MKKEAFNSQHRLQTKVALQEPISGPISLYEAMARALKYNLDEKIEQKEEIYKLRYREMIRTGMWPVLQASAGLNGRDNESGSRSRSLLSGRQSLEPSTSSEKIYETADLSASWNVIDFSLAYIDNEELSAETKIARERRRKVINRVLEDVRTAFWRAVSAERTYKKLLNLESLAQHALFQAQELEQKRLTTLLSTLEYQRDLLRVQSDVQRLQRELIIAKYQLAALINIPPNVHFKLKIPKRTDIVPVLPGSAQQMIMTALYYRPELREILYQKTINKQQLKSAFWEALPGFEAVFGANYNSNDYLYNDHWLSFSLQTSWDLLSVFRYSKRKKMIKAEKEVLKARQDALVMAIMTQVHVARARFIRMSQEVNTIRQGHSVQTRILALNEAGFKAHTISQQQLVQEYMNDILNEINYDSAYADLQNAYANLYASMGLDNYDFKISAATPLSELTEELEEHWTERSVVLPKLN